MRNQSEVENGTPEVAQHVMLGKILRNLDEVNKDKKLIVLCETGGRSAIAVSVLKANGFKDVVNMVGGYVNWVATK